MSPSQDSIAALRVPEFRYFIGMRLALILAYQMQGVAILYHIYQLTKDPFSLGLVGLCEAVPAVGLALFGGYIADKYNKKKIILIALLGFLSCSLVLLWITLPNTQLYLDKRHIILGIYLMTIGVGLSRAFFGPVMGSLVAIIVPKNIIANAANWNISAFLASTVIGPAFGGLLLGYWGISTAFGAVIIAIVGALMFTSLLADKPPSFVPIHNIWRSLGEGVQFVFKTKMMIWAMTLDLFSVFFGGIVALLPVFATEILHVGAQGFGILRAASPLGAVITMLLMTKYSPMNRPWRNLLIAVACFGVAILCFGLSKIFYISLICMFFEGVFDSVSMMIRSTLMQLLTPDDMRGRVSAVNSVFVGSSNEIGAFESGTAAKLLGTVPAVLFGGCMTLGVVFFTWLKTKDLLPLSISDLDKKSESIA